ncbi:uncharacterized protein LOC118770587 [Megalops cyprinoides]|uniref:uncharacterized protein LOC118770587 n=1 Tax=Megalops cyprinoides TaxID=118141 RepID=UPI0018655BB4|nr:uncharacterized protein LOC118770587 [Megalops cyprinoides]
MDTSNEIAKVTNKLTKASDCRDDTKILMQPYANWEDYLTPAPISIAILGELVFISSNVDFSIRQGSPEGGFKHVKYPDSFRACLMQVCNAGWRAFNEAHKNMDQIRLHTSNVPTYIKSAVKILLQDDDTLIQEILPDQLGNIDNIASDCLRLSETTEKKFMDVMELIQELLESCTSAKQAYGKELEDVRRKIEEAKLREVASQEAKKRANEALGSLKKQLDEAQKTFTESMNSMPSGWEVIGLNFVEGITDSISSVIGGIGSVLSGKIFKNIGKSGKESAPEDPIAINNICAKSGQLLSLVQQFKVFIEENEIKWSEVIDQQTGEPKTNWLKKQFENVQVSIKKEKDCEPQKQALEICTKAIALCTQLATEAAQEKHEDAKTNELLQAMKGLTEAVQIFDTMSKATTNTSAFNVKPPQMSQTQGSSSGPKSAGQIATDNARFKIEQSRAQLEKVRDLYDKTVENVERTEKELTEILVTMRNCEVKEIDFKTTIKILAQGLEAMGRVKEQWQKLVRFFQMVSNIIKTCLTSSLQNFVKTGQKVVDTQMKYSTRMFLKDMIYQQAFYASNISSLVHMISETYTQVSSQYLMDRVSSLSRLMSLDPSKPEFGEERRLLENGCEEAQSGIKSLVQKNKNDFDRKTRVRLQKIETELNSVLPPASAEEKKQLQEIVQTEFKKEDEDQYA